MKIAARLQFTQNPGGQSDSLTLLWFKTDATYDNDEDTGQQCGNSQIVTF